MGGNNRTPNDQRSDAKNPNNDACKADQANQAKQAADNAANNPSKK